MRLHGRDFEGAVAIVTITAADSDGSENNRFVLRVDDMPHGT
jgi:hypothetical protein